MALRRIRRLLAAFITLCALAGASHAQFSSRPVRILVPNPPGGATDTVARVIAPRLGELLGQPVVVENKPGSNGNLAIEMTAKAPADGLTLLLGADAQIVIGPHLYRDLGVDTLKDLAPVASLVNTQMVLAVNPTLPVKTLPEFVEYARLATRSPGMSKRVSCARSPSRASSARRRFRTCRALPSSIPGSR